MITRQGTEKCHVAIVAGLLIILFGTATAAANKTASGAIPPAGGPAGSAPLEFPAAASMTQNPQDVTDEYLQDRIRGRTARELRCKRDVPPGSDDLAAWFSDGEGPRFQGWYTRITGEDGGSVAVVAAAQYLPGMEHSDGYLPGYLAVIVGGHGRTKVYEAFPARTVSWSNRGLVLDDPYSPAWEEFLWYSDEHGVVTDECIDISIAGQVEVSAVLGPRVPYNTAVPWMGPEGFVEFLAFVPLHWFVYSLGSETTYTYALSDEGAMPVSGFGFAHQESNWGTLFPPAWVWAEGISSDNTRRFALSGGELALDGTSITTWLVAFHSPRVRWEFRPTLAGTRYTTTIDSCAGRFSMVAEDLVRKLVITAEGPPESFFEVSVPTENGFVSGARESFAAEVTVDAYLRLSRSGGFPLDHYQFSGAALEFGAGYMCR